MGHITANTQGNQVEVTARLAAVNDRLVKFRVLSQLQLLYLSASLAFLCSHSVVLVFCVSRQAASRRRLVRSCGPSSPASCN